MKYILTLSIILQLLLTTSFVYPFAPVPSFLTLPSHSSSFSTSQSHSSSKSASPKITLNRPPPSYAPLTINIIKQLITNTTYSPLHVIGTSGGCSNEEKDKVLNLIQCCTDFIVDKIDCVRVREETTILEQRVINSKRVGVNIEEYEVEEEEEIEEGKMSMSPSSKSQIIGRSLGVLLRVDSLEAHVEAAVYLEVATNSGVSSELNDTFGIKTNYRKGKDGVEIEDANDPLLVVNKAETLLALFILLHEKSNNRIKADDDEDAIVVKNKEMEVLYRNDRFGRIDHFYDSERTDVLKRYVEMMVEAEAETESETEADVGIEGKEEGG